MAVTTLLGDPEIDIDKILAQAEARLAATDKAIAPPAKLELTTAARNAPEPEVTNEPNQGVQQHKLGLRVPKLEQPKKKGVKDDAGPEFFHMPKTNLTPELKRDLQVLRMRNVLSLGKQQWKKDTRKGMVPEFSQVGTLVEGNTDGSNARLNRKERKRTIVEEVLGGDTLDKFKTKYNVIQERKTSGKKAHYKKLLARRRRG